jgi:hypothetical protein
LRGVLRRGLWTCRRSGEKAQFAVPSSREKRERLEKKILTSGVQLSARKERKKKKEGEGAAGVSCFVV